MELLWSFEIEFGPSLASANASDCSRNRRRSTTPSALTIFWQRRHPAAAFVSVFAGLHPHQFRVCGEVVRLFTFEVGKRFELYASSMNASS